MDTHQSALHVAGLQAVSTDTVNSWRRLNISSRCLLIVRSCIHASTMCDLQGLIDDFLVFQACFFFWESRQLILANGVLVRRLRIIHRLRDKLSTSEPMLGFTAAVHGSTHYAQFAATHFTRPFQSYISKLGLNPEEIFTSKNPSLTLPHLLSTTT